MPTFMAWAVPGAAWFHHELIPSASSVPLALDPRTTMAIWQLGNCMFPLSPLWHFLSQCFRGYMLLGLLSSFVFRAVRDALPNNPAAQERILGASFLAMAIADVSSLV